MEWANGQQAKEKHDIAHVHKALGAVSERSTDTFQAELDGVSEDRVNYMETLHFLAMHRTSLQAISEHFEFMRKKGIKIAEEHNNRHQIRKALGTLWGTISDEVRLICRCLYIWLRFFKNIVIQQHNKSIDICCNLCSEVRIEASVDVGFPC